MATVIEIQILPPAFPGRETGYLEVIAWIRHILFKHHADLQWDTASYISVPKLFKGNGYCLHLIEQRDLEGVFSGRKDVCIIANIIFRETQRALLELEQEILAQQQVDQTKKLTISKASTDKRSSSARSALSRADSIWKYLGKKRGYQVLGDDVNTPGNRQTEHYRHSRYLQVADNAAPASRPTASKAPGMVRGFWGGSSSASGNWGVFSNESILACLFDNMSAQPRAVPTLSLITRANGTLRSSQPAPPEKSRLVHHKEMLVISLCYGNPSTNLPVHPVGTRAGAGRSIFALKMFGGASIANAS